MEVPLPEIMDRMSILQLKIERVGELHLKKDLEKFEKALKEFKAQKIKINPGWLEQLYAINGKIWDLEWEVRKVVNSQNVWEEGEKMGFEELGRRAILVEEFMKERIEVKNKIIAETGSGFQEKKIDHCGEKTSANPEP